MNKVNYKKIVIKVGSNVLALESDTLNFAFIKTLVGQIAKLYENNCKIVFVTSGAVLAGKSYLNLREKKNLPTKQILAAIGQVKLMDIYRNLFSKENILVAQVLLTKNDFITRESFLNTRETLNELLDNKVIPIINENDVTATRQSEFGGNDLLSAQVAAIIDADCLINLTSVEGLYSANPTTDKKAKLISEVVKIDQKIERLAKNVTNAHGRGGMITKIEAAKLVNLCGIPMIIAQGKTKDILFQIYKEHKVGTYFFPISRRKESAKHWFIINKKQGCWIEVDQGAYEVLSKQGKSLLPVGVIQVKGEFSRGEIIGIYHQKQEIGCGQMAYSSSEVPLIMGKHSAEIKKLFGIKAPGEVMHRDSMVIY